MSKKKFATRDVDGEYVKLMFCKKQSLRAFINGKICDIIDIQEIS